MEQCFVPKYEMGIERVINCCTDPFPFFYAEPCCKEERVDWGEWRKNWNQAPEFRAVRLLLQLDRKSKNCKARNKKHFHLKYPIVVGRSKLVEGRSKLVSIHGCASSYVLCTVCSVQYSILQYLILRYGNRKNYTLFAWSLSIFYPKPCGKQKR